MLLRAFLAASLTLSAGLAAAQQVCAPRDQIVQRLAEKYGETRKGYGLQSASLVVELYASDETGTWTLIATRPDGTSCAMAVGKAWRPDDADYKGPPA